MNPIQIKDAPGKRYFQINWMLHDKCTYACSYCPPSNHAGDDNWLNLDKVIQTCDSFRNQVNPEVGMQILFSGGEPTVWKNFSILVEYLNERNWSLNMVSNLSRSSTWWKNLNVEWDQISASLHPEFTDIDSFIEKCNIIKEKSKSLTVRVMLHPDTELFKRAIEFGYKAKQGCPEAYIEWVPIIYDFGQSIIKLSPYTDEQRNIISKLKSGRAVFKKIEIVNQKKVVWDNGTEDFLIAQNLVRYGKNMFKGWKCSAGLSGVFINSRGEIYRGTCLQGEKIGNINDETLTLPTEEIICNKKICECVTDVFYPKSQS